VWFELVAHETERFERVVRPSSTGSIAGDSIATTQARSSYRQEMVAP
jgi:hypothetical protein